MRRDQRSRQPINCEVKKLKWRAQNLMSGLTSWIFDVHINFFPRSSADNQPSLLHNRATVVTPTRLFLHSAVIIQRDIRTLRFIRECQSMNYVYMHGDEPLTPYRVLTWIYIVLHGFLCGKCAEAFCEILQDYRYLHMGAVVAIIP